MTIKNQFKHYLGRHPTLFFPVYRALAPRQVVAECLLSVTTELVIEGFPRSANTFAVVAFQQAQTKNVSIAHYLHVEPQILEGVRRNLPVLVLLRNPVDAICSLMVRQPGTYPSCAFLRYCHFYEAVLGIRGQVVIAPFKQVTYDYGFVISSLNKRFDTVYRPFAHNRKNVQVVYDA